MGLPEESTHTFIVRVWVEEVTDAGATWRGQVTHVPSGVQRYVQELDALCDFVRGYLEAMGVRTTPKRRGRDDAAG